MDITILGIESSCDDTSAAVIRNTTLLSNVIASQAVHMKYGGAGRDCSVHCWWACRSPKGSPWRTTSRWSR